MPSYEASGSWITLECFNCALAAAAHVLEWVAQSHSLAKLAAHIQAVGMATPDAASGIIWSDTSLAAS